jgi:hypothetical protein
MNAKRGSRAPRPKTNGANARPSLVPPPGLHRRSDDGNAFMPDPEGGPARIPDDLAENLAEDYLQAATQGMEVEEDHDQIVPEEIGGPFVETSAADEFAHDTDEANPEDASREPLPRPVAGLVMAANEDEDND